MSNKKRTIMIIGNVGMTAGITVVAQHTKENAELIAIDYDSNLELSDEEWERMFGHRKYPVIGMNDAAIDVVLGKAPKSRSQFELDIPKQRQTFCKCNGRGKCKKCKGGW